MCVHASELAEEIVESALHPGRKHSHKHNKEDAAQLKRLHSAAAVVLSRFPIGLWKEHKALLAVIIERVLGEKDQLTLRDLFTIVGDVSPSILNENIY